MFVFRKFTFALLAAISFISPRTVIMLRSQSKRKRGLRERRRERVGVRESRRADSRESVNNMLNIWCVPLWPDHLIAIPVAWWPAGHWVLGLLLWNRACFSLRLYGTVQQLLTLKTNWPPLSERWEWGNVNAFSALINPCSTSSLFPEFFSAILIGLRWQD